MSSFTDPIIGAGGLLTDLTGVMVAGFVAAITLGFSVFAGTKIYSLVRRRVGG